LKVQAAWKNGKKDFLRGMNSKNQI